jgi:hypothetical protein
MSFNTLLSETLKFIDFPTQENFQNLWVELLALVLLHLKKDI